VLVVALAESVTTANEFRPEVGTIYGTIDFTDKLPLYLYIKYDKTRNFQDL